MMFIQWVRKQLRSFAAPAVKAKLYIVDITACQNTSCRHKRIKDHSVSYVCGKCRAIICSGCIVISEGVGTLSCPCCKSEFEQDTVKCNVREIFQSKIQ